MDAKIILVDSKNSKVCEDEDRMGSKTSNLHKNVQMDVASRGGGFIPLYKANNAYNSFLENPVAGVSVVSIHPSLSLRGLSLVALM